jgi:hypothetical protein
MLLFRSEEHVERWCAQKNLPRGAAFAPEIGWRLAQAWYHHKMTPEYRRFTLEEAEALLASLGLTGAFWNLQH